MQNPIIRLDKLWLDRFPLLSGCRTKTRLREELVQLDYWQPCDFAKLRGKSRFARRQDRGSLHASLPSLVLEIAEKGARRGRVPTQAVFSLCGSFPSGCWVSLRSFLATGVRGSSGKIEELSGEVRVVRYRPANAKPALVGGD